MKLVYVAVALLLCTSFGCAVVTTPIKVVGTAVSTSIKTTGAVVSAPFKAAGNAESDKDDG